MAVSLDGFIARPDGSVDWLDLPGEDENEDYGFTAFMDEVDALVMGRNTYDTLLGFGAWPYGDTPLIVLTHRPVGPPDGRPVETSDLAPIEVVAELSARGFSHLYVDGGATVRSFLDAGLIDRITLTTIPVILGDGIRLFEAGGPETPLRHVDTVVYPNGLVQTTHDVVRT